MRAEPDPGTDRAIALLDAARKPIRQLSCACCGAYVRGRQWHNRDTGYMTIKIDDTLRAIYFLSGRGCDPFVHLTKSEEKP